MLKVRDGVFNADGSIKLESSNFRWFLDELNDMKVAFREGRKEDALQHEENCMWIIGFMNHEGAVHDAEYELYIAEETQMKHPRRVLDRPKKDTERIPAYASSEDDD